MILSIKEESVGIIGSKDVEVTQMDILWPVPIIMATLCVSI